MKNVVREFLKVIKFTSRKKTCIPNEYFEKLLGSGPLGLKIEITNACNARCNFCAYKKTSRIKVNMDEATFDKVLREYVAMGGGYVGLMPVVGEVFLNKDVVKYLTKLKNEPKITFIETYSNLLNLSEYKEDEIEIILDSLDQLVISTGANKQDYERAFGVKNGFSKFVNGVDCLVRYKKKKGRTPKFIFSGRSMAMQPVVDGKLAEMISFLSDEPVDWIQCYLDWSGDIEDFGQEQKIIRIDRTGKKIPPCEIGLKGIVIFSNGEAGFCNCSDAHAKMIIGNIHKNSLKEIFKSEIRREYARSFEKGTMHPHCARCGFYRPFQPD